MKQLILLMSLGLSTSFLQLRAAAVVFLDMDLNAVRELAGTKGSLYFAFFSADWCAPCKWMEERTFQDDELGDYVRQRYLAVRVDIDQRQGRVHQERYQVKLLPTILVFNAQGQLLVKIETAIGHEALLEILKEHDLPKNRIGSLQNQAVPETAILESPKPILHLYRPPLPTEHSTAGASLPPPVMISAAPAGKSESHTSALQPARDFFAPRSEHTFSINIADYDDYEQAVRQVGQLEAGFKEPVQLLGKTDEHGRQTYRIFIGLFADRASAEKYLYYLRRKNMSGAIEELR